MALDEVPDDDAVGFRAPLPAEDRVWRHPAEVGRVLADRRRRRVRRLVGGAASVTFGVAVVAIGAANTTPGGGSGPDVSPTTLAPRAVAASVMTGAAVEVVADAAASHPSVARLAVITPDGVRWGAAVVVAPEGVAVTAASALDGAEAVRLAVGDDEREATVLGIDAATGLAVLRTPGDPPVAEAADAGDLRAGAAVAVLVPGGPGEQHHVYPSRLVALHRAAPGGDGSVHGLAALDLPLGRGEAGAAVVVEGGAVAGITLAGPDRGYAVPIDVALAVADDVVREGRVRHVWLGITGREDPDTGRPVVDEVAAGSPAEAAGVQPGDVMLALDDAALDSFSMLLGLLHRHRPGQQVSLRLDRGGTPVEVTVELTERAG